MCLKGMIEKALAKMDFVSRDEATLSYNTTTRGISEMRREFDGALAVLEAKIPIGEIQEDIGIQLYVDDEVANPECWSGLVKRFGYQVAFEITIEDRYKLNEAKDAEKLWVAFNPSPSGWAALVNAHGCLEDGIDTLHGSLNWKRHPDLGSWMVEFEFLRKDGSRGWLSKHNNYDDDANGRVIESGTKFGGTIVMPPAY